MRRFCKIATRLRSTTGTQRQFLDVGKVGQKVCYIKRRQSHKKGKDRNGPFVGLVCDEVANLLKIFMRKFLSFAHLLADAHQMLSTGIV